MVRVRLARAGAKNNPFYHVTVADQRFFRDGRFIERIGYYHPTAKGKQQKLSLRLDRLEYWLARGVQPSATVANLAKKAKAQG